MSHDERRIEDRRKMKALISEERRMRDRRKEMAEEAGKSAIHAINEFRKRQKHTLGMIHPSGHIVIEEV